MSAIALADEHGTDRGVKPPEIHLYDPGSYTALCGHKPKKAHSLPFTMGIYDCEICWGMHLRGFAS